MADLLRNWLLDPTALLFLVSLLAGTILILRRSNQGSRSARAVLQTAVITWLLFFILCSSPVVVNPLLTTIEGHAGEEQACTSGSHIVVLSGGVDSRAQSSQHFEHMSKATMARATQAWRFALAEPETLLVVAGGAVGQVTEADVVANYWIASGIASDRIVRETRSSNTYENALNVRALLSSEEVAGPVRLITSALHMPRALRSFEKVFGDSSEIDFCQVSVDRQALSNFPFWAWMPQTTALAKFDKWLHEAMALLVYRLRGWI